MKILFKVFAVLFLGFLAGGCTTKIIYTQDELEEAIMSKLNLERMEARGLIPFTANEKIMEISTAISKHVTVPKSIADAIIVRIIGEKSLNVVYEPNSNLTAYEVTIQRTANCIAYTNLFVAIARSIGLEAVFVDVTQQVEFETDEFFNYQEGHICAGIKDADRLLLFDFVYNSKKYKRFRVIDDLEAIANFMTILGVENDKKFLTTGNPEFREKSLQYHLSALTLSPKFTRAMNNLAVIFLREGKLEAAEKLLEESLDIDDTLNISRFNLAELYVRKGDLKTAKELLLKNLEMGTRDPYTHYRLGQIYFSQKMTTEAEYHLKRAISLKKDYIDPRLALISLFIVTDKLDEAEDLIEDSESVFPANEKIDIYRELLKNKDPELPLANLN